MNSDTLSCCVPLLFENRDSGQARLLKKILQINIFQTFPDLSSSGFLGMNLHPVKTIKHLKEKKTTLQVKKLEN